MSSKLIIILALLFAYVSTEMYQIKINFMKIHCRTSPCNKVYISAHERVPPFNAINMFTVDKRSFYNKTHKIMDIDIIPAGKIQIGDKRVIYNTIYNSSKILHIYVNISINEIYANVAVPNYCRKSCYAMIDHPHIMTNISTNPRPTNITKTIMNQINTPPPHAERKIFYIGKLDNDVYIGLIISFVLLFIVIIIYSYYDDNFRKCICKPCKNNLNADRRIHPSLQIEIERETIL